jgi:hypothetical protein
MGYTALAFARAESSPECHAIVEAAWHAEIQRYQELTDAADEGVLILAIVSLNK